MRLKNKYILLKYEFIRALAQQAYGVQNELVCAPITSTHGSQVASVASM